ncbi:hypothetical protein FBU30_005969 [Linnemannia zychae]|nr:hypothetical protein FBU30_005969 [Linnemannia zychae]
MPGDKPLKEPIQIKPMDFATYLHNGLKEYIHNLRSPSVIPGKGPINKVDPNGTREALEQLSDLKPKDKPSFSYYITHLLLILSTLTYERDDKLVKEASEILEDIENEEQKQRAATLLLASEETIDRKAQFMGMRFEGISELKSLGGPYAGLFYNEDSIVLVFKGTSVLAFNEYIIDGHIQRVNANEYLYGEVHKGFYESLFPDPLPLDETKHARVNRTSPFNTIMETIFATAMKLREKSNKPVNLWMTGHSLGGALAALTMARLQLPLSPKDPLFEGYPADAITELLHDEHGNPRTVFQEMLARFNSSHSGTASSSSSTTGSHRSSLKSHFGFFSHFGFHSHHHKKEADDLVILRDCYSFASPKLGDTAFAKEFNRHQIHFMTKSPYKPIYYRVITEKDIIPMMPPSCNTDPDDLRERLFPCVNCPKPPSSLSDTPAQHTQHSSLSSTKKPSYGAIESKHYTTDEEAATLLEKPMNSLLDYKHVGQMIRLFNSPIRPLTKASDCQTDLCGEVQRSDQELSELLKSIQETVLVQQATQANTPNANPPKTRQGLFRRKRAQETAFCAQEVEKEMELAKIKYDLDQESRLRMPCTGERIMLKFPFVISHSPATYQRNLVMARFYFESFPGTDLEQRLTVLGGKGACVDGSTEGERPNLGMTTRDSAIVIDMDLTD